MGNNSGDMKRNHKKANRTMITKDKSITSLKKMTNLFLFRCAQQQMTKLARWFFIVFVTTYTPGHTESVPLKRNASLHGTSNYIVSLSTSYVTSQFEIASFCVR